jgi:hypothetical protein
MTDIVIDKAAGRIWARVSVKNCKFEAWIRVERKELAFEKQGLFIISCVLSL